MSSTAITAKKLSSVDRFRRRVAADRDHDAGERRPDDAPEVVLRRRQRDRAGKVFDRNEVGEDRLERGEAEPGADPVAEHDDRRGSSGGRMADREQDREQGRERGLHERRRHEQPLAREAVGERAADRAEERDRDERGRRDRSRPRGLVREVLAT